MTEARGALRASDDPRVPELRRRFLARMAQPHNWLAWQANWATACDALGEVQGLTVDLGCGVAPYRELLMLRADRVVAVDWPTGRHGDAEVEVFADVSSGLPFRDGCAGTVTAFQVMEHLRRPASFLAEAHRILVPGGHLILTVPWMWGIHEAPHDYFRYTRFALRFLAEEAGFEVLRVQENTGFWGMWFLKLNYRIHRTRKGWRRSLWRPAWYLGQVLGRSLDARSRGTDETAGYLLVARKPGAKTKQPAAAVTP